MERCNLAIDCENTSARMPSLLVTNLIDTQAKKKRKKHCHFTKFAGQDELKGCSEKK